MQTRAQLLSVAIIVGGLISPVRAQINSPEVDRDGRVTFRTYAPEADTVLLKGIEGLPPQEMSASDDGTWEVTVGPLEPELYSYVFEVDGADQVDRSNRSIKTWFWLESLVLVPGDPPLLHEPRPVPHGVVRHHRYNSAAAERDQGVYVYTPPDYDPERVPGYPVVILMHGFGDDENAWIDVGRAPDIADNMYADGSIEPMIIAMPYGHPIPAPSARFRDDYAAANTDAMEAVIKGELLPLLERQYNLTDQASGRAIVGLSMGGGQSLTIGLRNPDRFSYVGGFSSAAPDRDREELFAGLLRGSDGASVRLVWIGCGRDDFLFDRNNAFSDWLRDQGIAHTYEITDGGHTWLVWRRYLQSFLPLLFRD